MEQISVRPTTDEEKVSIGHARRRSEEDNIASIPRF
jgi:hypothetical protein